MTHKSLLILAIGATLLAGCATAQQTPPAAPTWVDRGHGVVTTPSRKNACYGDAKLVSGKRITADICYLSGDGFRLLSGFKPQVEVWINDRRHMLGDLENATKTGLTRHYPSNNITLALKCEPIPVLEEHYVRPGDLCELTVNDRAFVSVSFYYTK